MTATPSGETRKSAWIPWAFVGFFLVVVLANAILAAFAFGTWTGLSTQGAYEKGLAYNRTLEERARQATLGWRVAVDLERSETGGAALVALLRDRSGTRLWADSVTAKLTRPTRAGLDQELALDDRGRGLFASDVDLVLPGQWDVTLTVTRGNDRMVSHRRVFWSP